jgi:ABC-type lipoprotein export system ATPase subunit
VPQSLGLLHELTIIENVRLPARLDPTIDVAVADHLVDRLGLGRVVARHPDEVSLGEQQRAALARAAAAAPAVLVADEPIAHQNGAWAEVMMEVVVDLRRAGTTCLLATHNEIAFRPADRIVTLVDGHVVER